MPRQPYLQLVHDHQGTELNIGPKAIGERPALEVIIGNCLMAWPNVEAEMALFFGELLGIENAAALAVFQTLRRSSSQRDAIMEAARVSINVTDLELVSAILNVHKSIEAERNALSHGHFGTSNKIPDGILWVTANDYVTIRIQISRLGFHIPRMIDPEYQKILSTLSVYREPDLLQIKADIKESGDLWVNLTKYLHARPEAEGRDKLFDLICGRPHVARELKILRQKNTPRAPSE